MKFKIGLIIIIFLIISGNVFSFNNTIQLLAMEENKLANNDSITFFIGELSLIDSSGNDQFNKNEEEISLDSTYTKFELIESISNSVIDSLRLKSPIINSNSSLNDSMIVANFNFGINSKQYKFPGKAMLMSGIVPGLGELYIGNPIKAMLFAGIEAGAWLYWSSLQGKIESKEIEYKKFADEHWDFKRWVENYYAWENYEKQYSQSGLYTGDTVIIDDINMRRLFSEQIGENEYDYMHINEGSHTIHFFDPRFGNVTFPDSPFGLSGDYFYCSDYDIIEGEFVCKSWALDSEFQSHLNEGEILVVKNLHFYENVGKYNHFFMGWNDAQLIEVDSLYLEDGVGYIGENITYWRVGSLNFDPTFNQSNFIYNQGTGEIIDTSSINIGQLTAIKVTYTKASIFNNDGYLVAKSPDKWKYRNLRNEYNKLGKVAGYAISAVMFNHVISMIDAVISTNIYNQNISAEPIFDPNAKLGFSGIRLNFYF